VSVSKNIAHEHIADHIVNVLYYKMVSTNLNLLFIRYYVKLEYG